MVQGISSSSGIFSNVEVSNKVDSGIQFESILNTEASKTDADKQLDKVKSAASETTTCPKCGAMFMGTSIAVCPKCGSDISQKNDDSAAKMKSASESTPVASAGSTADSSAVSGIDSTVSVSSPNLNSVSAASIMGVISVG